MQPNYWTSFEYLHTWKRGQNFDLLLEGWKVDKLSFAQRNFESVILYLFAPLFIDKHRRVHAADFISARADLRVFLFGGGLLMKCEI